jgi:hypothetical protein
MSQHPPTFLFHGILLTHEPIDRGYSEAELDDLDLLVENSEEEFSIGLLEQLETLCLRHPHIPNFHHAVARLYLLGGKKEAAERELDLLLAKFPTYLYGRTVKAIRLALANRPSEALLFLGESLSLKDLYPDRAYFQVKEYLVYYQAVVYYHCAMKEWEAAERCVDRMTELDPEDGLTGDVQRRLANSLKISTLKNLQEGFSGAMALMGETSSVSLPERSLPEQRESPPELQHPELQALYQFDMAIEHDLLRGILALPRQSLIQDLEEVLKDSLYRYEHFANLEEQQEADIRPSTNFPLHALFLMKELRASESLPVVLECLAAPWEALEFWYGDFLTEGMWMILYELGQDDLPALFAFLHQEDVYDFSRTLSIQVFEAMGVFQPERKPELLQGFKSSIETFRATQGGQTWSESYVREELLNAAAGLQFTELTELGLELLTEGDEPTYEEERKSVFQDLMDGNMSINTRPSDQVELRATIFETYDRITQTWYGYTKDKGIPDSLADLFSPKTPLPERTSVPIRSSRKVGRNEPCPCGSGKKYKKCCLNK